MILAERTGDLDLLDEAVAALVPVPAEHAAIHAQATDGLTAATLQRSAPPPASPGGS